MPKVKLNRVELNYEEQGSGEEKVVFIHGFQGSARSWRELWSLLPANYHAYALDLRGHGKSAHVTENCTIAQFADDVYRFSHVLGLGKFIYLGECMGGLPGIQLALDYPEVLKALVLVSTIPAHGAGALPADILEEARASWRKPEAITTWASGATRQLTKERLQEMIEDAMVMEKEAYLSALDSEIQFNQEARLGEIKVPTLMFIGAKDQDCIPEEQYRTARGIPGVKVVEFENEGHLLIEENPQKFISELTSFIAQLRDS